MLAGPVDLQTFRSQLCCNNDPDPHLELGADNHGKANMISLILLCCLSEPIWYDALPDCLPDAAMPMPVALATDTETTPPETAECPTGLCRTQAQAQPDTSSGKSELRPAPVRQVRILRRLFGR
jgi:hypothetical protein